MLSAYIIYPTLLLISPLLGRSILKYVYPEVQTYVRGKKWALFVVFGLLAYVPAAILGLFEFPINIYSPFGHAPVFFEYEGNTLFATVVFLGILALNASFVDFVVVRRQKRTTIGIPTQLIRYGIKKEVARGRRRRVRKEIVSITNDLESEVGQKRDIKPLLAKIRESIKKERVLSMKKTERAGKPKEGMEPGEKKVVSGAGPEEEKATGVGEEAKERPIEEHSGGVVEKPAERAARAGEEEMLKGVIRKKVLEELEESMKNAKAVEGEGEEISAAGGAGEKEDKGGAREVAGEIEGAGESMAGVDKTGAGTAATLERSEIADKLKRIKKERKEALEELEKKLGKAKKGSAKGEKTEELLKRLKEKIKEDAEMPSDEYGKEDIKELTRSIRGMRGGERAVREKGRTRHARKHGEEEPEEEVGESLTTYVRAYPEKNEKDLLKVVVGDVREQLRSGAEGGGGKGLGEGEEPGGDKRWYEKTPAGGEAAGGVGAAQSEEGVELFEQDIGFDEGLGGDLGDLGEDLEYDEDDLSSLESMDQDLESGGYDNMLVDVGEESNTCPNCGKKGVTVVYCPNCGKPLCSNCALSVEGTEDYIKYTCPHCKEEFAVKRRVEA